MLFEAITVASKPSPCDGNAVCVTGACLVLVLVTHFGSFGHSLWHVCGGITVFGFIAHKFSSDFPKAQRSLPCCGSVVRVAVSALAHLCARMR